MLYRYRYIDIRILQQYMINRWPAVRDIDRISLLITDKSYLLYQDLHIGGHGLRSGVASHLAAGGDRGAQRVVRLKDHLAGTIVDPSRR